MAVVGLASVIPCRGVRNISSPGMSLSSYRKTTSSRRTCGSPKDLGWHRVPLLGCRLLYAVAAKLLLAFGHSEGTYLRRQIMVAYGVLDFPRVLGTTLAAGTEVGRRRLCAHALRRGVGVPGRRAVAAAAGEAREGAEPGKAA